MVDPCCMSAPSPGSGGHATHLLSIQAAPTPRPGHLTDSRSYSVRRRASRTNGARWAESPPVFERGPNRGAVPAQLPKRLLASSVMLDRNQGWPTVISRQDFEEDVHIGLAGLIEHGVLDGAGFEEEFAWPVHDGLASQHGRHISRR